MIRTEVNSGVCQFKTTIEASSEDSQHVTFTVTSTCKKIQGLGDDLPEIDAYQEIGTEWDGALFQTVKRHLGGCCTGCVVPSALFKSMQAAAKIALPADVAYTMTKV